MTDETAQFQRRCSQLRDLTTVVLVLLGATLILPFAVEIRHTDRATDPEALARLAGEHLVSISPAVFYLCGLWAVRRIFSDLAAGRLFQPALAQGLRDLGWNLAWGAGMDVVGAPMLTRWIDGEPGGHVIYYNPAAIALGVVALALVLLSRLLKRAADMQAELDQFI